jgi:hypothetical protein
VLFQFFAGLYLVRGWIGARETRGMGLIGISFVVASSLLQSLREIEFGEPTGLT